VSFSLNEQPVAIGRLMNSPLVSICLPNLNTLPYLQERIDTIFVQTYPHWELIISDNYSDDGAWPLFEELARKDPRVSISQAPKEGLYPNWNNCVRRARGKYIYIATSDDTMAPNCIEEMVAALERHPECDLALCPLLSIDEAGQILPEPKWPECSAFSRGLGDLLNQPHVHRAPYDGMLHLLGNIIYNSITQLLIRRTLFDRIGGFLGKWGSAGDFNWEMKASLVANTVYVPGTWASWRVHPKQATASAALMSPEHFRKVDEMIADAFKVCEPLLAPVVAAGLKNHWIEWVHDIRAYYAELRGRPTVMGRRVFQCSQLLQGSKAARSQIIGQFTGKPKWSDAAPEQMREWLESVGQGPAFTPVA
jgi:glycosyltransferase involved in cell wall biosynthesis